MDILVWIVFGLDVGIVAKFILPGRDPGGIVLTIVLGIVGAMVGGWLGRVLGFYRPGEAAGFIMGSRVPSSSWRSTASSRRGALASRPARVPVDTGTAWNSGGQQLIPPRNPARPQGASPKAHLAAHKDRSPASFARSPARDQGPIAYGRTAAYGRREEDAA